MKTVDVVGAVIVNEAGEVLCALRSQAMSLAGHWEFPGGKIEPGEAPEAALRREIQEELGCDIQVGEFVAECTYDYPNVRVRLLTYLARITSGETRPAEHEVIEWKAVGKLSTMTWAPADLPTVTVLIGRAETLLNAVRPPFSANEAVDRK